MRIALPVWEERISPVFDTANRLLVVDTEQGRVTSRSEFAIGDVIFARRAAWMTEHGVKVLLCGALSRPLAGLIRNAGIRVFPFLSGEAETVLTSYLNHGLPDPRFLMPGCGRGRGRRRRRGRGGRAGGRNPPNF